MYTLHDKPAKNSNPFVSCVNQQCHCVYIQLQYGTGTTFDIFAIFAWWYKALLSLGLVRSVTKPPQRVHISQKVKKVVKRGTVHLCHKVKMPHAYIYMYL